MENFGFAMDMFRQLQGIYPWIIIYFCILLYYLKTRNWKFVKIGFVLWIILFFNDVIGIFWAGIGNFNEGIFRFFWTLCAVCLIAIFLAETFWKRRHEKNFWLWSVLLICFLIIYYPSSAFYSQYSSYQNIYQLPEGLMQAVDLIIADAGDNDPLVMGDWDFLQKARSYNAQILLLGTYLNMNAIYNPRFSAHENPDFPIMAAICIGSENYSWEEKRQVLKNTDADYIVVKKGELTEEYPARFQEELDLIGTTEIYDVYRLKSIVHDVS